MLSLSIAAERSNFCWREVTVRRLREAAAVTKNWGERSEWEKRSQRGGGAQRHFLRAITLGILPPKLIFSSIVTSHIPSSSSSGLKRTTVCVSARTILKSAP